MESIDQKRLKELQESGEKLLVDYWASWCGPCRVLMPLLEKLEPEFPHIKFVKVNVSENTQLAQENSITSIPTLMFYNGFKLITTTRGLNKEDFYRDILKDL